MYQYATTDIRTKISKNFTNISEKQLHQFITIIARCRNVCAHGERLFSFRIQETIPDTLLHKKLQIPQKNGNYQYGKQDLFAVVIALRYLISSEDFKAFKSNLTKLINNVLRQCPHLTHEQLLMEMGFPENWEKIMRYKKWAKIINKPSEKQLEIAKSLGINLADNQTYVTDYSRKIA